MEDLENDLGVPDASSLLKLNGYRPDQPLAGSPMEEPNICGKYF